MAFAFVDYKGLQVGNTTPTGDGGAAIDGNARELADRVGPVAEIAGTPGLTDDDVGGGGNGTFFTWSKWRDTGTDDVYICVDPATGAAVWKLLTAGGLNYTGPATTDQSANVNIGGQWDAGATIAVSTGSIITGFVESADINVNHDPFARNAVLNVRATAGASGNIELRANSIGTVEIRDAAGAGAHSIDGGGMFCVRADGATTAANIVCAGLSILAGRANEGGQLQVTQSSSLMVANALAGANAQLSFGEACILVADLTGTGTTVATSSARGSYIGGQGSAGGLHILTGSSSISIMNVGASDSYTVTANEGMQLGKGANIINNSAQIGDTAVTGLQLCGAGLPGALANGQVWSDGTMMNLRSDGVSWAFDQQLTIADPTDLATALTAIASLIDAAQVLGLVA